MPPFDPFHMYPRASTLPADFCSSTDALHPLAHSLFFHLLKWQDVLVFVGKGALLVLHHLKLRQAGDTQVLKEPTDEIIPSKLQYPTILGGISHFGLLCMATLTKGWGKKDCQNSFLIIIFWQNAFVYGW